MKRVTIDRATWRTGRYGEASAYGVGWPELLNSLGFRCCLGFLGQACGLPDSAALLKNVPSDVIDRAKWPASLFELSDEKHLRTWESEFVAVNDATGIDDATREAWIAEGFRTVLGYEAEFVGEYPGDA